MSTTTIDGVASRPAATRLNLYISANSHAQVPFADQRRNPSANGNTPSEALVLGAANPAKSCNIRDYLASIAHSGGVPVA